MTTLDPALVRYFAERRQERATAAENRLTELSPRERWLVHDAAVMGYVLGAMAGEAAVRTGQRHTAIPADSVTVRTVMEHCQSGSDHYPVLAGNLRDLAQLLVYRLRPAHRDGAAAAVAELGGVALAAANMVIDELIADELLTVTDDGLLDGPTD